MVNPVKVYSTQSCPWCVKVKDFLKQNNVKYQDVNVGEDQEAAQEMVEKSGQMGVPVTEIGKEIIIGFDVPKLKKALGLK